VSRTSLRTSPVLAGLAALALALGACGDDEPETGAAAAPETTVTVPGGNSPGKVAVQAAIGGFDAQGVYADVAPGVVTILAVLGDSDTPIAEAQAGQGSGFVLNEEGEIATNAHVVTDAAEAGGSSEPITEASEVYIEFSDRNQVPAEIVGFDPDADVALLKVDPEGLDLQPVELGDSDEIEVGQPVAALGSPFGQEQSMSTGIISATDRSIESLTDFRIDGAIQTDASINPGNSGGPLVGADGRVIGVDQQINTTSGGNEGVGFAVPINLVKRSIEDLRDDGEAAYAYIGVKSQALYPQLAEKLGIDAPTGSLISEVIEGGPADEAGLRGGESGPDAKVEFQGRPYVTGGDAITAVDGEELQAENDLSIMIAAHEPGDEVTVSVIRDGESMDIDVTLGKRPSA